MRVNPTGQKLSGPEAEAATQAKLERITRMVAIVLAFASTFGLFIKILFF